MKDCPECKANYIAPEDWDYANDGAYPTSTKREEKREHTYCGMRLMSGGDWKNLILTRRGGALIHNGGK
jgi:hypothetical protein